jgi:hypothetical protein
MKDILCVAAFVGKLLCLMVFVSALRPDRIEAVQASMRPAHCKAGTQACGPNLFATTSETGVRLCSARPSVAHC